MAAVSGLQAGGPGIPLLLVELVPLPLDVPAPVDPPPLPLDDLPPADPLLLVLLLLNEPPPDDPLLDVVSPPVNGGDNDGDEQAPAIDSGTSAARTAAMRRQPEIRAIGG
jgi:hypothetical protein